jgi:hypothetical protein
MSFRRTIDDTQLIVLVPAVEPAWVVDNALAYGLVYQEDRDLHLVLPDESRRVRRETIATWEPTAQRLAHIVSPVRLWSHHDGIATEQIVPARVEAIAATRKDENIPVSDYDLGDRTAWVEELLAWADAQETLEAHTRSGYATWQCAGRQVLKINRTRNGLCIVAGVDYKPSRHDKPQPVTVDLTTPITSAELDEVRVAIDNAVAARISGDDAEDLGGCRKCRRVDG